MVIEAFTQYLTILSKEMIVLIISMMPIAELKIAIPLGISLGLNPLHACIISILGSMVPVPFILLFLRPLIRNFYKTNLGSKIAKWITVRTMNKSKKIKKYRLLGLFIFVAIPLPTTGVWTGSAAAALLNMRIRDALIAIFLGNCCAATIMVFVSNVL